MTRKTLPSLLLLALTACASAGGRTGGAGDPDLITRSEIEESGAATAYELVQSLRPQWLRPRGLRTLQQAAGTETLVVYVDNARLGEPEAMRQISLGSVQYLRYLDPAGATHRWGAGHLHGAILISIQQP